jgi:hypothetical protein
LASRSAKIHRTISFSLLPVGFSVPIRLMIPNCSRVINEMYVCLNRLNDNFTLLVKSSLLLAQEEVDRNKGDGSIFTPSTGKHYLCPSITFMSSRCYSYPIAFDNNKYLRRSQ